MSGRKSSAESELDASGLRIAIVASRFNAPITERLVEGALESLRAHGAREVPVTWVAGAFELPLMCRVLVARADGSGGAARRVDALVALGCVVRGETPHFEYVCSESARGIMQVMLETAVPIAFGVLTTETMEQAEARAGGALGNKGSDAAETAIEMARALRVLASGS